MPKTRPLYTAPLAALGVFELSTAITAWVGSGIVPAQAEIVPSSVSKIKEAGMLVPGTRNPVVSLVGGFHTRPVGAAGVWLGGLFGSTCLHALLGMTLPGRGI